MRLVCSPPRLKTPRSMRRGICNGQILTFIKITIRVQTSGGSTSLPAGPAHLEVWHGPKRKVSGLAPSQHLIRHHSPGAARLSGTSTTSTRILSCWYKDPSRSQSRIRHEDPRSSLLPRYLQLDSIISVIHGFDYAARSFPRSKHYNAPISV